MMSSAWYSVMEFWDVIFVSSKYLSHAHLTKLKSDKCFLLKVASVFQLHHIGLIDAVLLRRWFFRQVLPSLQRTIHLTLKYCIFVLMVQGFGLPVALPWHVGDGASKSKWELSLHISSAFPTSVYPGKQRYFTMSPNTWEIIKHPLNHPHQAFNMNFCTVEMLTYKH